MRSRLLTFVALLFAVASGGSKASAQQDSNWAPFADVHLRNACRLAVQVLTKGEPKNRTEWALREIPRCGPLAGQVVGDRLRNATLADRASLDLLIGTTWGLQDATLFNDALDVAESSAAPEHARIEALRVLLGIVAPDLYVSYEGITGQSRELSTSVDTPVYRGDPLPANYLARLSELTTRLSGDTTVSAAVRTAAGYVGGMAQTCARSAACNR